MILVSSAHRDLRKRWDLARRRKSTIVVYFLLAFSALLFVTPVLYLILGSLRPENSVLDGLAGFLPTRLSLASYRYVFDAFNGAATGTLADFYLTSFLVALVVVVGGLIVNSLAGYALARLRWRGRRVVLTFVVLLVIVPFESIAVPLFYMLQGYRNTVLVQAIPFVASAFSIYLFYTFFLALPPQLEEAAKIDGAGPWRTFLEVIVPNAKPAFASVAILTLITTWGSFLWPLMMVTTPSVRPLPVEIGVFLGVSPPEPGPLFAFGVLLILPMAILFIAFQRWFIKSVAAFAVKG